MLKPRIKIRIYKFTWDSIRVPWLYYMLRYGRIVIVSIYRSRGLKFGTLLDDFASANLEVVDVCRFIGEPSVFFHIKAMEIMIVT